MRLIKCKQALEPVFMHAGSHGVSLSSDGFIVSHDEVMDAPVLFWMDIWKMILRERGVLGWGWGGLSLALRTTNVSRFGVVSVTFHVVNVILETVQRGCLIDGKPFFFFCSCISHHYFISLY